MENREGRTDDSLFYRFPGSDRRADVALLEGQILLALGDVSEARKVLAACLRDYPLHPSAERARDLLEQLP